MKETHRDRLQSYIQSYCRAIPPEVFDEIEPHKLLAFVMDRFAFLEEDFGKTVKVEIRDPETTLLADESPSMVIETRLPDAAFIIRTIKSFLREQGLGLHFVLHPIHGVIHDHGQITGIDANRGTRYSQVYMQVSSVPPERREALRADLAHRLELTLLVNRDRHEMMARFNETRSYLCAIAGRDPSSPSPRESQSISREMIVRATANEPRTPREIEADEAVELIDWLKDDNFIIAGYAWFPVGATTNGNGNGNGRSTALIENGLGLFAAPDPQHRSRLEEVIGEIVATRRNRDEVYSYYRTDYMTVVRSVAQVRYFGIAQRGADGKPMGEHVFIGLMSTKALKTANRRVPVVKTRIREVMAKLEEQKGSYAFAKSVAILDSMPVEDLFYWHIDEIRDVANQFRLAESRDSARVFVWRRPNGRRITVVCVVPRMRFSEALREQVSQEVRKFLAVPQLREYRQETDDESPIRLHFTVGKYRPKVTDADLETLTDKLELLLESWDDRLRRLVFKQYRSPTKATAQSSRYLATTASAQEIWNKSGGRFPESYKGSLSPDIALLDINLIEKLDEADGLRAALVVIGEGERRHTSLRIVSRKELLLNDVVPVLHRMALRTTSRLAERLVGPGPDIFITGFEITGADGRKIENEAELDRLGAIVHRVLGGHLLDDRLLGLGYLAELDWRQIDLLITYRNYFVQVFSGLGVTSVDDTLLKHPAFASLLVEYFELKFSTDRKETPAERSEKLLPPLARKYEEMLQRVTAIQEDLLLRYFIDLFEATRRTNYYRPGRGDTISIKIESALVEHMPRPCPVFEIYVHAPGVEGIHLRGGMVARGGLRHSDRPDDFRTEVLGLQRTQALKNVIIVPQGAKGGFVTRKLSTTREEARAQYQVFIAGLLDITDNYVGSKIVPPPGVIRYDDDDPYLVVAADKGTAHLSDTANAISQQYKFWLDDAFASGGSAGYDHKVMGITSRGGWTNVERHFREMGIDIRKTSIRVAGVGDMSGDVFGNGMLLNDKLRVVAAFNHKHVFIDPEPDPAISYAERKRLFVTAGTQWSDYRPEAISKGGGVFERAAKEITLSPQVKALLGIKAKMVSGPDLVRAILALDVDLMWFGGIGTYVKASTEAHGEVGDKVNDHVRINASELRAKVIGEGANLAITQRARTEYLTLGGRCNTDAIDNSAGVDCSDHEVNLKILLSPLMLSGKLPREERDKLLRELEADVAAACVQDNYLQSALLSMEAVRSRKQGEPFLDLLTYLDKHGLSRTAEHIPADEELRSWLAAGKGLTRNLLAVLVAHTKNDLYERVLSSKIPDVPLFQPYLFAYFPQKAAEQFKEQVTKHHLRREIIATVVTNALINQAGCTLLVSLCKESSYTLDELVVRYFICDELLEGRKFRAAVHGADYTAAAHDQYAALLAFEEIHRSLLRWWIWNDTTWKLAAEDVSKTKPEFHAAVAALVGALDETERAALEAREADFVARGFTAEVASTLARAPLLHNAFSVLAAAKSAKLALAQTAPLFHRVGRQLHVDAFDEILAAQVPGNVWERRFHTSLERDAATVRQRAVNKLAADPQFVDRHREWVDRIGDSLGMVKQLGQHGLVPLYLILEDYRTHT
ncbi:MAG: NAD-glutamate dehydrogenase [Deltaproteobacteria bacterium]|nr:NAD-glutamate dehydrogenase [Deltaproteobacteria bacterium]MDQ3295907.1 NAD-glutamate dehydrogenase [Myxococcota bacterium]